MNFKSIKTKLVKTTSIIFVVSFVLVLSVVAYLNTTDSNQNLKKSEGNIRNALIAKGKTLSNNNSQALKGMVEDNAFSAVQDLVSSTVRDDEDISYGIFMDADLAPWVHATAENIDGKVTPGTTLEDEQSIWASELLTQDFKIFNVDGNDTYEFASPVIVDEEVLGVIRYGFSTKSMRSSLDRAAKSSEEALKKTLYILLGSILLSLLIGILSTQKMAHHITLPLNKLQSAAGRMSGGDYEASIDVTTNDEIGVLADNFEVMRLTIQKKMADLAKLNSTGEVLASLLDQEKALEIVLQTMHEQIGVGIGSIYLMNNEEELEVKAFFPPKMVVDGFKARKFHSGEGIIGQSAKTKKIIFVKNTKEDEAFSSQQGPAKSLLCVPLLDKDIIIGVMNLSGNIDEVNFEDSDNEFISSIARLLVITIKNIRMREVIEEQNRTLEQKVEARTVELAAKTNDILSMLTNMHQGLFTVMDGGIIHHEYAAYLETIFETNQIANRNVMDLLFSSTELGSNTLDQIKTAMDALIGEDEMMFDFNSHHLITEVSKTMPSGAVKILDFDWDPIILDGEIDKIMVTVRDVTELKALEKEAEAQKQELEIIGQILNVGEDKMAEFTVSAYDFIEECEALIKSTNNKDADIIAKLFRNIHTVKGNARTYGFTYITDAIHDVESTYDNLRKDESSVWQQQELLEELERSKTGINHYQSVAVDKLNFKLNNQTNDNSNQQINSLMSQIESVKTDNLPSEIKQIIQQSYGFFLLSKASPVSLIINEVVESVKSIASQLDKPEPNVAIENGKVFVLNEYHGMLNNIFMHIFRNAIDHGIESASERESHEKSASGNITLTTTNNSTHATISINDDGRGLAINKLFEKAVELEFYELSNRPADIEIANLIFKSGFSTAEELTDVSGRGVGMDAVREFLLKANGSIEICLDDNNEGANFRPFTTKISLPKEFYVIYQQG